MAEPMIGTTQAGETRPVRVDTQGRPQVVQGGTWTVTVGSLPPLPAGGNHIGSVTIQNLPTLPSGNNHIGRVGVTNLPSLPAGSNLIGKVDVGTSLDPTVNRLLTNVTANGQAPTATCNHAYKTFSFGLTGTGSATITLFGSADGVIFIPLATFKLNSTTTPADGISSGATSYTKFYAVVSEIQGAPTLNGTVMGVF